MTSSTHIGESNAAITKMIRQHPEAAAVAGAEIHAGYEKRLRAFRDRWPEVVSGLQESLKQARMKVLDPRYEVPAQVEYATSWLGHWEMMVKRQRDKSDLESVAAEDVFLDWAMEQARACPTPDAAKELLESERALLDPVGFKKHLPSLEGHLAGLLVKELSDLDRPMGCDEAWHGAILLALSFELEVPAVRLGFPEELPLGDEDTARGRRSLVRHTLVRLSRPEGRALLAEYSRLIARKLASVEELVEGGAAAIARASAGRDHDSPPELKEISNNRERVLLAYHAVGSIGRERAHTVGYMWESMRGLTEDSVRVARRILMKQGFVESAGRAGSFLAKEGVEEAAQTCRALGLQDRAHLFIAMGVTDPQLIEEVSRELSRRA
jgi:hypothetical protein